MRRQARRVFLSLGILFFLATIAIGIAAPADEGSVYAATPAEGSLQIFRAGQVAGFCPLRHTGVQAGISGLISRVLVTQEFANPSASPIEAVYTFPLPQDAAVDDMTIQIGARTIRGLIERREEAAAVYANAIRRGQTAALLDQERPNIFTQTIGNIPPGQTIRVTIAYVARLKYEDGGYEFVFPMVVGPRYIPGTQAIGQQGGGWAPDTDQVPDASLVTPLVAPPGMRAGHDISFTLALDAGVPIRNLRSPSHDIDVQHLGPTSALVRLRQAAEIPNKDLILRYDVAGSEVSEGILTHTAATGPQVVAASLPPAAPVDGYFTLVIQPPERFPESDVTPKEMVFVLDSSGSMNGFPEAKSKRLIDYAIDGLYPGDTFNVIKFSGDTDVLFEQPVYPTAENVARAKAFVDANWGGGGTEMMDAIRAALAPSGSADHVRIVVFLTDGYVGNDLEIIGEIQQHPNARIFAYGIGASVNRFLLDKMAEAGNGAVEYVSQKHDDQEAETVAHRLYERLRAPLLTDIALDFGSLPVAEVYPRRIPDLFSARPVVITGRYNAAGHGVIRLLAKRAGDPYTREIPVSLPALQQDNPVLASLWARGKIDDLMTQDWTGLQQHTMSAGLRNQIAQLGLDYRLMTPFTSFVAVEERVVTDGGKPQRIQVPVELPEGVQYEPGWSVETQSTAVGMLISAKQMQNLPLNGRNFTDLMQSAPGVTWINPNGATATSQRYGIQSNYAVAGSRPVGQAYVLNNAGVASPPVPSPTPAPRPVRPIETKLHPRLVAAYDCWQAQADKANAPKACNLEGDKLAVMVVLAGDLNAGLSRLKAIGFKPAPGVTRGKRLVGHISVGQLAALAEISAVQFVAPAA